MSNVIVVGGGAGGMMAALSAASCGHTVTLLEKNEKLGKKIYITGKGRCNFTNACDMDQLFAAVVSNPKFLYSAFYGCDNRQVMDLFSEMGMDWKIERGNRVFPVSDHASDITGALERRLKMLGVAIRLFSEVTEIETSDGKVTGVRGIRRSGGGHSKGKPAESFSMCCDALILATGGCSYPTTGSTGDGYRFAETTGHRIVPVRPALVPLVTKETYIPAMQGLSLKNVSLTIKNRKGKVLYQDFGEMLFTHFGVSGPLVLSASSVIGDALEQEKELFACIDLKPALSLDQLQDRLLREFGSNPNRHFANVVRSLLPAKMVPCAVKLCGIPEDKVVHDITKEERMEFCRILKAFPFTICGTRGFGEAIITQGGVCVKDVNPSTMESKKVKGLYFAGEMLDLDAVTGGYNLQIAWSTGYLAGESIPW